jgi:hypothetical protein
MDLSTTGVKEETEFAEAAGHSQLGWLPCKHKPKRKREILEKSRLDRSDRDPL